MELSFSQKLARRLGVSALAFGLIAVGSVVYAITAYAGYRAVREMAEHDAARQDAMETLLMVERTFNLFLDLETGQRGFMLSGKESFLDPFVSARSALLTAYPRLTARLERSVPMALITGDINDLMMQRLALADSSIAERRGGASLDREMTDHVQGKQIMDQLRIRFMQLRELQSTVVDRRQKASERLASLTSAVVAALMGGGTLLMVCALWVLRRERALRDQADRSVIQGRNRLEQQVTERTAALSDAMVRIKSFAGQLDQRIEEERKRLSRDVHDQLGQINSAAKLVAVDIGKTHPEVPTERIRQLTGLLDEAIVVTRRIAAELRPPMLDDLGLAAAVNHHLKSLRNLSTLKTEVDIRDDEQLSPDQANQLFRIVQEASTNVLRHAQASLFTLKGCVNSENYVFELIDNGRGPQDIRPGASGLRNMEERAFMVGGSFRFQAAEGGGTHIQVKLPMNRPTP